MNELQPFQSLSTLLRIWVPGRCLSDQAESHGFPLSGKVQRTGFPASSCYIQSWRKSMVCLGMLRAPEATKHWWMSTSNQLCLSQRQVTIETGLVLSLSGQRRQSKCFLALLVISGMFSPLLFSLTFSHQFTEFFLQKIGQMIFLKHYMFAYWKSNRKFCLENSGIKNL